MVSKLWQACFDSLHCCGMSVFVTPLMKMHLVCSVLERYVPVILNMKTMYLSPCLHGNALSPKASLGQIARAFHLTVSLHNFFHVFNKLLESYFWDQRLLDGLQSDCDY